MERREAPRKTYCTHRMLLFLVPSRMNVDDVIPSYKSLLHVVVTASSRSVCPAPIPLEFKRYQPPTCRWQPNRQIERW
jgi:hypothetical protein